MANFARRKGRTVKRLLDQIVTTFQRDFAPGNHVGHTVGLAIFALLVFLSGWALFDTWKSADSEEGLPPPGPRIRAMLGITFLRQLLLLMLRSPIAPTFWVCTALLMISAAILGPAALQVRERSRLQHVKNNMKQLGTAMHSYRDTFLHFPNTPSPHSQDRRVGSDAPKAETPRGQNESAPLVSPLLIYNPTGR